MTTVTMPTTTQIDRYKLFGTETLLAIHRQSKVIIANPRTSDARRNTRRLILERIEIVLRERGVTP